MIVKRFVVNVDAVGRAEIVKPSPMGKLYIAEETSEPGVLRLLELDGTTFSQVLIMEVDQ